jgi:hypothetical protein
VYDRAHVNTVACWINVSGRPAFKVVRNRIV